MRCFYVAILFVSWQISQGIDIRRCPKLEAPENGHMICDHLLGAFCAPVCEPGFEYASTPATAYVCNPMTKSWATYPAGYPLPWPNCISSKSPSAAARKSSLAFKKSQVDQMIARPVAKLPARNESLWQRMLKLTSELSQKKLKGISKGAARSDLVTENKIDNNNDYNKIDSDSSYNSKIIGDTSYNSNVNSDSNYNNKISSDSNYNNKISSDSNYNNVYPTSTPNQYQTPRSGQLASQGTEFQKLQEYWNDYYKKYYESLNINVAAGSSKPDWTQQSPWSNDPEHVDRALDKDTTGKEGPANSTTMYDNWNSYLQSLYQYPTPSRYQPQNTITNTTDYSPPTMPNSSSDNFIDNVIANDLQAKKIPDATANRDLYYEDQLIHSEEEKRPYLNSTNYLPTLSAKMQRVNAQNYSQTTKNQLAATNQSYSLNNYKTTPNAQPSNITSAYQYPANSANSVGSQASQPAVPNSLQSKNDSSLASYYTSQTTPGPRPLKSLSKNSASSNDRNSSAPNRNSASKAPNVGNSISAQNKSAEIKSDKEDNKSPFPAKLNSTGSEAGDAESVASSISHNARNFSIPDQYVTSESRDTKTDNSGVQSFVSQNPTGDPLDETDYLDDLDITALVRELIKLETIRKQKQMRRRKKIAKENMKTVGNMMVGDVFKGYFKNKEVRHQKALKKQLLNKARVLLKANAKGPPLPKFS